MPPTALTADQYCLLRQLEDEEEGDLFLAKRVGFEGFEKLVEMRLISGELAADAVAEARLGALLTHAKIAHVLDVCSIGQARFVVTEHVEGETLEALLCARGPIDWRFAARIGRDAAAALRYVQARRGLDGALLRLVHRRLSPSHIRLTPAGELKLTGFGSSWASTGHNGYRSPEESRGEPVDGRADVYSLGLVLRTCVRGLEVPSSFRRLIEQTAQRYPEHRPTPATLHDELSGILHAAAA